MSGSILNEMNENGVSETIGGVLLIGLTVVGITLIGVLIFSQPVAEEVPAVDVLVSNIGSKILFLHNGGNSLNPEDFTISVGGAAVDASVLNFANDGGWPWSVGETIVYTAAGDITPLDENVRIAYREDAGVLLRPAFVDDPGTNAQLADVSSTPLPTLSPGVVPVIPSPEDAGVIVADYVLADSDIIAVFSALEKTAILEDKYFNFTVVSPNSTMNFVGNGGVNIHRDLDVNDEISIYTVDNQAAGNRISISGVGKTFFSLRFEKVNVRINGNLIRPKPNEDEVEIQSAWIPEYKDLESTLAFRLGGNNEEYQLYIDGILDSRGETGEEITMENVRPTESGMFFINAWSSSNNPNSIILAEADGI